MPHFHIKPVKRNPTLHLNKIDKRTQTKLQQTKSEERTGPSTISFLFLLLLKTNKQTNNRIYFHRNPLFFGQLSK